MKKLIGFLELTIEKFLTRLGFGMRAKLILIFVVIKVIPLVLLSVMAWRQAQRLGEDISTRSHELTVRANEALSEMGKISVHDSVGALNSIAIDNIERMSTDMARDVADFLYARDDDIRYLAGMTPDEGAYRRFAESRRGRIVRPGKWVLSPDGKSWVPEKTPPIAAPVESSNPENENSYHNRVPDVFEFESRPLYKEITFVDLAGNEKIKVTTSPRMDRRLKNVANRRNTFIRAETYFAELKELEPGEIYVSDVIGAYVGTNYIGMYAPGALREEVPAAHPNADLLRATGNLPPEEFLRRAEEQAYAGRENPYGKRFEGIVRWAMPVTRGGKISGYVTFALDHDHIMEFTDRVTPMKERYTEMPSAYEGNYAFIWDYRCRSICHPRHHSIYGFNPETGLPEIPWLEEGVYNEWQASGKSYHEFIEDYPPFAAQSRGKKPAAPLTKAGLVGLDGRYLNHAPQCTGWFDLTREGGSGSFLILWSGIWKPNTAAAIPYYTGSYGKTKRGFGFVAIGAGLEDFEKPARETEKVLGGIIDDTNQDLVRASRETDAAIASNLWRTTLTLAASAGLMIVFVVLIAIWMASIFTGSITRLIVGISRFREGERQFRFNAPVKDELGVLADSFDEMADSIVDSAGMPLSILDMEGNVIYVNDKGLALLDKKLDEVTGKPYSGISLYPADSPYDPIKALEEKRDAEVIYLPELNRYVRGNAAYLTDKVETHIGYIVTTTDHTEIIVRQKTIAEQRALLDTVFNSSPDIIWYTDTQNTLLTVNPRYASLFGKTPAELVGKNRKDLMAPEKAAQMEKILRAAVRAGGPVYSEDTMRFGDGHEENLDILTTPILDASGELAGFLCFARDVSSRVRIEQELRTAQEKLQLAVNDANMANKHKGEFLARMSHEIRTPMNAIIGMTNIAKKKLAEENPDMDGIQENIQQIGTASQHLLGLLNDILDISKIEAGKIELSADLTDMEKLARTVESIIRTRCDEKNIVFTTLFRIGSPSTVFCDDLRLRQVLLNLLGNAVKFTPEFGEINFSIIEKERKEDSVCFEYIVKDSGIGIAKDALPTLFRPFKQASSTISKNYGGTGLGLVISKSIVHLFGSDISVESEEGKGSVFSFELWLPEARETQTESLTEEDATDLLAGKRALLVDDVAINRTIAISQLEFTGLAVDEAEDGQLAVQKFAQSAPNTYDIIYMDIQMPIMDGYIAAKAIRALARADAKTIPIVALTANAFKEDIDKAIEAGMNAHLAKPMELDKVLEVTFRFISLAKTQPR